jgi:polysaccharide biosynthesis protein PslJ
VSAPVIDLPLERTRPRSTDAVTLLSLYVFLLLFIPSPLVLAPLGAAGGPATIYALVILIFYLVTLVNPPLALNHGPQPIRVAMVLMTCAVLATYISINRHTLPSLEQNGADRGLIFIFGWLGVSLVAADGITTIDRLKTLLGRLILGAATISAIAIAQFFSALNAAQYIQIPGLTDQTPLSNVTRNQLNRPNATALHPLELALVLAICLPIAIHRARFAPPQFRARRWAQAALIGVAIPLTVSRSALIAIVVASLVTLPTWPKRDRRVGYVVGLFATIGLFASSPRLLSAFRSLFGQIGSDSSSASRTGAFSSAGPFISQHPWFGRGFGTFLPATYFFTDDQYLLALIEIGFIGLIVLVGLFVTGWMTARNVRRISGDPELRDLAQSFAASVAVPMVGFATLDSLSFPMAAGVTFLVLGCVGALWRLVRTETSAPGGKGPPPGRGAPLPSPEPMPDAIEASDTQPIPVVRDAAAPVGAGRVR